MILLTDPLVLFLFFTAALCIRAAPANNAPLAPDKEAATFHFADVNLTADLVAAEPEVVAPVAIAWDSDGRLFVAEMSDYPNALTGGQIKLLEDRDGDGRYQRATVFVDKLPFPTSLLPWRGGLLVTAAPNIWFFKDNDGDGRADERRVLFTGFGEGNQQLRVNGLTWSIDNWVYGANGRSDGEIRRPNGSPDKKISIRRRDFRFRPDTGEFEAIAGQSQFGTTFDDWGNRFLSWNTLPFRHVVVETRYLDRVPQAGGAELTQNLQPPGDDGRVYPLTPPPQVFNNESLSHFNASAGTAVYRGDALGEEYRGNLFVGETLRNLVHRRMLVPKGVTYEARRAEEGKEFLASTDPWFHPVNFATGPDGALYVVDFYRLYVEHPDFVPLEMRTKVDWRKGAEHGRIWRLRRKDKSPAPIRPQLSRAKSRELLPYLGDENAWWRGTAQRLLLERQDTSVVGALEKLARKSTSPLGRLHALYTLDGLRALRPEIVLEALRDSDARVREHAIRLSELFLAGLNGAASDRPSDHGGRDTASPPLSRLDGVSRRAVERMKSGLFSLSGDPDERIRFQLALTLGAMESGDAIALLGRLAEGSRLDHWQALAILSSVGSRPAALFVELIRSGNPRWETLSSDDDVRFLEALGAVIGASAEEDNRALLYQMTLMGYETTNRLYRLPLLAGAAGGMGRTGRSLNQFIRNPPEPARYQAGSVDSLIKLANETARSNEAPLRFRLPAIRILANLETTVGGKVLLELLLPGLSHEVESAAVAAVAELNDPILARGAFASWTRRSRSVRQQVVGSAARSPAIAAALLEALDQGEVARIEVDASTRQSLLKAHDAGLRQRAEAWFGNPAVTDRAEVLRQFLPCLQLEGDRGRGAIIFARTCLMCHAMQGRGNAVGPNIYSVASQPKETLLASILDPSRQVTPDYLSYAVTTADGETLTGLIVSESATTVTLRRQNVPDATLQRNRIKEINAEGKSLMPDGLEEGLTPQDIADLLTFVRQPEATLLPKENENASKTNPAQ